MLNVAITGGIGSGKSTVVRELKLIYPDANFFSMDEFVDELYEEKSWLDWLQKRFNTIDRKEISRLGFANHADRAALNAQSALKIGMKLGKALLAKDKGVNFIEFPLLFETGMQDQFDLIIHITAPFDVRVDRVMVRDGKTRVEVMNVILIQMPEEEKQKLASKTIDTSSFTPEECAEQIRNAILFHIAVKAGIFDEDGNLAEIFK